MDTIQAATYPHVNPDSASQSHWPEIAIPPSLHRRLQTVAAIAERPCGIVSNAVERHVSALETEFGIRAI